MRTGQWLRVSRLLYQILGMILSAGERIIKFVTNAAHKLSLTQGYSSDF